MVTRRKQNTSRITITCLLLLDLPPNKKKDYYKLGVDYETRLTDFIGVGGTFDFTGTDFDIFAFSVGADFYLFEFPLIPAIAIGAKNYESKWDPFVRVMAIYDFHKGDLLVGPMVMYDLFPNQMDIMSYGINIGYSLRLSYILFEYSRIHISSK